MRNPSRPELEADGPLVAGLAAGAADDRVQRQAVGPYAGFQGPGRCFGVTVDSQCRRFARLHTFAAEIAGAAGKIDSGEFAPTRDQNVDRAGGNTVAATRTFLDEQCLRQRPGGADCSAVSSQVTTQKLHPVDRLDHRQCYASHPSRRVGYSTPQDKCALIYIKWNRVPEMFRSPGQL